MKQVEKVINKVTARRKNRVITTITLFFFGFLIGFVFTKINY